MLQLTAEIHEAIMAHGAASYPYEGCGLLLGVMANGRNTVSAILPMANHWPVEEEKRERFRITGEDMVKAEMEAMRRGVDVIGIFHSHPDCPPIASPRDLAWATWPGYSYIITEVLKGNPTHSRSWQLSDDRTDFVEEPIEQIS